jgi:hypothetical protein
MRLVGGKRTRFAPGLAAVTSGVTGRAKGATILHPGDPERRE